MVVTTLMAMSFDFSEGAIAGCMYDHSNARGAGEPGLFFWTGVHADPGQATARQKRGRERHTRIPIWLRLQHSF
jgi:hypothetical protein